MAGRRYRRVERAVAEAEAQTGLQFCVFLGNADSDEPHALAERLFQERHPAVLLVIVLSARRVEILTAAAVRDRVTDAACEAAIEHMRPHLRHRRFDHAIVTALRDLAEVAGPGVSTGDELPDLFDETDGDR